MPIVHVDSIPAMERNHGRRFGHRVQRLSRPAGSRTLQCSLYEVDPGRCAFPFHAHHGTEEALYILSGTGRLRVGQAEHEVGPGVYAAFPPGRDHAHQLTNTGDEVLRYLCFSADADPDVVEYPDSGKLGVMAGFAAAWPPAVLAIHKQGTEVDYYDGEDAG